MFQRFNNICAARALEKYLQQAVPSRFDNVVVAMSSGVDSSVCASLYAHFPNVRGIYMQNWSQESEGTSSSSDEVPCYERDWKDVKKVAKHLNIPVERINFEKDYWLEVFEPMLQQYEQGYTPNPDVNCNKFIKFGTLRETLDKKLGANNYWLVTGHYARILKNRMTQETHLLKSYYSPKDQSYYLSQLKYNILPHLLMPIGHLSKPEVRSWAAELGLPTAEKQDSQGICFVNNTQHTKFRHFLREYLPTSKGHIITVDETNGEKRIWGEHDGLWSYTVGQKVGISMPQGNPLYHGAWYVAEKRLDSNELVIVRGKDNKALYRKDFKVKDFQPLGHTKQIWRDISNASEKGSLRMQYRSLQEPIKITAHASGSSLHIKSTEPQRAIAPGQFCCLYSEGRVLGSGPIDIAP